MSESSQPPNMVMLQIERDGHAVKLGARIATPSEPVARGIDSELPTIVFCHPTWMDSYFFYPQSEDPFFKGYNLVTFDMRGHGYTATSTLDVEFNMWSVAEDVYAGMSHPLAWITPHIHGIEYLISQTALGIQKAHVVGVAFGATIATALASAHPAAVRSLVLVSVLPSVDDEEMASGFADCKEAFIGAMTTNDAELLDAITTATFEYDVGSLSSILREVRDEYMGLARQRLQSPSAAASAEDVAHYIWNPVTTRRALSDEEIERITAPTLILQGFGGDDDHTQEAEELAARLGKQGCAASLRLISGVGHFMTLTSPNIVNPLIAKFINTPNSADLSFPAAGECIAGPALARRASTPRGATFELPPIPRVVPGMRTFGDELDRVTIDIEVVSRVM